MTLPSGYTQLEYIEASGTQYFDTGFIPNQDTSIVAVVSDWDTPSSSVFGTRISTSSSEMHMVTINSRGVSRSAYGSSILSFPSSTSCTSKTTINRQKNVTSIGSESVTNTEQTFTSTYPLYLCGTNTGGSCTHYFIGKLYSCQIYDNATLVRDFIPCKNTSGTVGLWDDVNDVFYGNAGTGSFTAGPEVDPTAPVGDHNTLIGGVAREVEWMTVLLNGVSRDIESGTVLVNGVVREIEISSSGEIEFYIEDLEDGVTYTRYASEGMVFGDLIGNSTYDPDGEFRGKNIVEFKPTGTKFYMVLVASASWSAASVRITDTIIAGHTYGAWLE